MKEGIKTAHPSRRRKEIGVTVTLTDRDTGDTDSNIGLTQTHSLTL